MSIISILLAKTMTDEQEEYLSVDILLVVQNLRQYYHFDNSVFLHLKSQASSIVFR